ncbi:MAG: glycosyltransferase [Anaerolineae bacterium]|nr:glycosyltransferase [Anaerolineae bacterium]
MHIAVLTHNYPRFPGDFSGNFVASLSRELVRQGADVTVIAPWDAAFEPTADNFPQMHLWRYAPRSDWHRLGYARTMEADVRMRGETYWLAPMFFAAGTADVLRWCRQHRPDVIHAHWLLPGGYFGAVASRLLNIPLAVSIPGSDALVAAQNPLFRRMARFALDQAGLITANSESLRDVAVNDLGADPGRFDLIIYGVDDQALHPDSASRAAVRAELGVSEGSILLLAVGRMVYKKGFDGLVRALGILRESGLLAEVEETEGKTGNGETAGMIPPIVVVFVGDGDLRGEWEQAAQELGIYGSTRWLGTVPFDQIHRLYNACDAMVMPAVTRPATGLAVTVLDAMACARPIIASDAAGNGLVVQDGVNGYLTPERDDIALAAAIARFAALSADRRAAMGRASRRLVETQFSWPHLARRYLEHFERLIDRSPR